MDADAFREARAKAKKLLEERLEEFQQFRHEAHDNRDIAKESQQKTMLNSMLIKKEVSDMADTMDVLSQIIRNQDLKTSLIYDTIQQSKSLIDPSQQSKQIQDKLDTLPSAQHREELFSHKIRLHEEYVQLDHGHEQKMISRHSPFYIHAVEKGRVFKSSNRNEVLLGHEEKIKNTHLDDDPVVNALLTSFHQDVRGARLKNTINEGGEVEHLDLRVMERDLEAVGHLRPPGYDVLDKRLGTLK